MVTGPNLDKTESWNGSSWTEVADLNTTRYSLGGAGVSNTSAVGFGGYAPGGASDVTETWNGSSWTEVNNLNLARYTLSAAGEATDALAFGGEPNPPAPTNTGSTEAWDGTNWYEVNAMNTSRGDNGGAGHLLQML